MGRRDGFYKALGQANNDRGRGNEARVLDAFKDKHGLPGWLKSMEPASHDQDKNGIDAIALTDVGKIFVQVKSSRTGLQRFVDTHQRKADTFAIVVIHHHYDIEKVRSVVLSAISEKRSKFLSYRASC